MGSDLMQRIKTNYSLCLKRLTRKNEIKLYSPWLSFSKFVKRSPHLHFPGKAMRSEVRGPMDAPISWLVGTWNRGKVHEPCCSLQQHLFPWKSLPLPSAQLSNKLNCSEVSKYFPTPPPFPPNPKTDGNVILGESGAEGLSGLAVLEWELQGAGVWVV